MLENVSAYRVGAHQHAPEIEQALGFPVCFVPHLLPVRRGLLVTCYAQATAERPARAARGRLRAAPAVRVLPEGVAPELARVQGTDAAELGALRRTARPGRAIVICALDNLGKGAAGQAVQNANLALGLDETAGLRLARGARMSVTAARGLSSPAASTAGIRRDAARPRARALDRAGRGRGDVHDEPRAGGAGQGLEASTSRSPQPQAVVVNSGIANAATGERGELDARATAAEAARLLGLDAEQVLVLSTGVIGLPLPLDQHAAPGCAEPRPRSRAEGGADAAERDPDHRHARRSWPSPDGPASRSAAWRRAPG